MCPQCHRGFFRRVGPDTRRSRASECDTTGGRPLFHGVCIAVDGTLVSQLRRGIHLGTRFMLSSMPGVARQQRSCEAISSFSCKIIGQRAKQKLGANPRTCGPKLARCGFGTIFHSQRCSYASGFVKLVLKWVFWVLFNVWDEVGFWLLGILLTFFSRCGSAEETLAIYSDGCELSVICSVDTDVHVKGLTTKCS